MKSLLLILISITLIATGSCKKEGKDLEKNTTQSPTPKATVQSLLDLGNTVQQILDKGYTPKEIYDNDSTYRDSLYGKTYQAGLIFAFNMTDGTGMVAAPTDDRSKPKWGCYGTAIPGADGTAFGTGKQNTIDILAGCRTISIAADKCNKLTLGGYTDWFLPSYIEISSMNDKLHKKGLGDFGSLYWTSTELSNNNARALNFTTNSFSGVAKLSQLYVRAVRTF